MKFRSVIFVVVLLLLFASHVAAHDPIWEDWDGRINVVDHFGGDVLYCTSERGCWMLNINGQLLWEVPQSDIDEAMDAACETGITQVIEAGQGTYGPVLLAISCDEEGEPFLNMFGYDEWGKLNELKFQGTYDPVGPPVGNNDSDGDGIPDNQDACPNQGSIGYGIFPNGCPIIPL